MGGRGWEGGTGYCGILWEFLAGLTTGSGGGGGDFGW